MLIANKTARMINQSADYDFISVSNCLALDIFILLIIMLLKH